MTRVVIGVGNELRRDDGFGPAVVERLRAGGATGAGVVLAVSDGEPTRLIDLWDGTDVAVVVDALRSPVDPPGHRYELDYDGVASLADGAATSHGVGLGHTVELARALGRLPGRLVVLAAVGRDFGFGQGLDPALAAAVDPVARRAAEVVG
jgi:hydrogenase maturation protease